MTETIWATDRAIAVVRCVWFISGVKDAKLMLEQALGFVRREEIVLANHVYVTIEAAGSGKVLAKLQALLGTSVSELKKRIFDELCDTNKDWSSWRDICLFQGHGGPELNETSASLVCDTTLVLATRLVKTGVFFSVNRKHKICRVFYANKYLVTRSRRVVNVWNLWTGQLVRCCTTTTATKTIAVGDELFVNARIDAYGDTELHVHRLEDYAKKHTFLVSGRCGCAFLLQHDTLLVTGTGRCIDVYDVVNKHCLWTGHYNYFGTPENLRISPTGDLVTFTVCGKREFMSRDGRYGFATVQHEQLCHVPKPALTVSLVHGDKNVMVARTTY